MSQHFRIIVVCIHLIVFDYSLAQELDAERLIELNEQVIRLEEQNNILSESQRELRQVYMWALGFSGTFLLAFLGVNIYFTRTKYQEDRAANLRHIEDNLKLRTEELGNKFEVFEKNTIEEIENFNKKFESLTNNKIKDSSAAIRNLIDALDYRLSDLEVEVTEMKGTDANTITACFEFIERLKTRSGYDWRIITLLEKVENLIDNGCKISSFEKGDYITILDKLPANCKGIASRVKGKVETS